jgi:hypothetical protein
MYLERTLYGLEEFQTVGVWREFPSGVVDLDELVRFCAIFIREGWLRTAALHDGGSL